MKRATRFLIHLYPKSWRGRYAAEFDALLADIPPTFRGFLDVFTGALKMQLTTWTFPRIIAVSSIAGLVIAAAGSFLVQDRYRSQAVIAATLESRAPNGTIDHAFLHVNRVEQAVLSTTSLSGMIQHFNLYSHEQNPRRWMVGFGSAAPMEQLVEKMRRAIAVLPIDGSGGFRAIAIQFDYPDRVVAQRIVQELTAKFIDANVNISPMSDAPTLFELLDPASLPADPVGLSHVSVSALGLFSGMSLGLLIGTAVWLRRRNRGTGYCPNCGQPVTISRRIADAPADHP